MKSTSGVPVSLKPASFPMITPPAESDSEHSRSVIRSRRLDVGLDPLAPIRSSVPTALSMTGFFISVLQNLLPFHNYIPSCLLKDLAGCVNGNILAGNRNRSIFLHRDA